MATRGICGWAVRDTSGLVTRHSSGRQCKVTRLDLDLCKFALTPRKAGIVEFSLNPARLAGKPSAVRPSFPKLCEAAPGRSFSHPPSPLQRRSAEVVAPTFMQKIPEQTEAGRVVAVLVAVSPGIPLGRKKRRNAIISLASFPIRAPHDRPTRAPCSCQCQPWEDPEFSKPAPRLELAQAHKPGWHLLERCKLHAPASNTRAARLLHYPAGRRRVFRGSARALGSRVPALHVRRGG